MRKRRLPTPVPVPGLACTAMRSLAIRVVMLLLASPVAAQVPPGNSLTLQAAIDRALAANPTIAAARLTSAVNMAGLAVASEWPNPEATVEFEKETPRQGFGVAVPVELGGKRSKRIAVSQATIRAGEAGIAATIAQVRNDVRRAYVDVLVADARLTVLRELRDLSQRVRDAAQTRFDAGGAPRLEVLQAGLALAAAENESVAAAGTAVAARTRLNVLLGAPLDTSVLLSTALDAGGPIAVDAVLNLGRTGTRIDQVASFDELVSHATSQPRFTARIVAAFGVLALVLASIGIYGTLSFIVAARTREIAIRLSLGESWKGIVSSVLKRGLTPVFVGCLIGIIMAAAIARAFASLFFQFEPIDAASYTVGAVLLLLASLVAALAPTRHILRVDPSTALRAE